MMKTGLWHVVLVALCIGAVGCGARADVICPKGDINADCRVDVEDLVTLGSHWLEGSLYPQTDMAAHWRFDEPAGTAVLDDSGNGYDGQLNGGARIPDGVYGPAIQFDGVDDFIQAPCVLDPANGPLSAFAWVKGGQPRQAILAQADGSGIGREWLQADANTGMLLTRLTDGNTLLASTAAICDGEWRHVGVVWDGARRHLYVDGVRVASDAAPLSGLLANDGHMYIGRQRNLDPSLFWSGCIDDVRIYDRALADAEVASIAAPPAPTEADLDGRGTVDLADFSIIAHNWMLDFSGEYRCIWIDSWNAGFLNATQANDLIATCRENNINTVIVEIRKVGDAYYNSAFEPRATNISGGASFDPLGYLCQIAHDTSGGKKYIEVHAWFVAQRISTSWPLPAAHTSGKIKHVLHEHPEYVMLNADGQPSNPGSNTRFLDPGHPGAVEHNVAVVLDCLSKYDIDGVNLDYIRYPEYSGSWGYNPVSIARFNAFYGKSGQPSSSDPDWSAWRRECVTNQVKKIYVKSLMIAPHVVLTVDTIGWGWTWADFENSRAYAEVFQDWVGWLRAGIVDYNTLMGYVRNDPTRFEGWSKLSLANDDKRGSILCTGAYMQDRVQDAMDQLLLVRSWGAAGLNIYDWGSEVNGNDYGETRDDFYRELKQQVFPTWVDPPMHAWKVRPETGIIEGTVTTAAGAPVDHAKVRIYGRPETATWTDGSGWYAIVDVEPGTHVIRCSAPGRADIFVGAPVLQTGDIATVNAAFAN